MFFTRSLPSSLLHPQVSFPICPLEDYNADATTKQNILCDGRSARQVILDSAAAEKSLSDNGTSLEGEDQIGGDRQKKQPLLRFEYLLPSRPQLFVLVLDRSSLPAVEDAAGKKSHMHNCKLKDSFG